MCDFSLSGDKSTVNDPECVFGCACGKCDLATYLQEGCPSSLEDNEFPYLFPKRLSKVEFRMFKSKLRKASQEIVLKFASLDHNTISMLKRKEFSIDEVKNYVLILGAAFNESIYKREPLLLQERDKIERVKDFDSLFIILKRYYSWFNYGMIEALRGEFLFCGEETGSDERLNNYKKDFHEYCRRRTFECPKSLFSNPHFEGFVPLTLKVDDDFNIYNLNRVEEFQLSVSEILGLSKYTLQLCEVTDGCVTVVFRIPSWLRNEITVSNKQQQEQLMHIGVKQLRVMMCTLYEEVPFQVIPSISSAIPLDVLYTICSLSIFTELHLV